jgi:fatty-acyl-CoA synthase
MDFNLGLVHEAIAARMPDRECLVFRDRRFTWGEVTERTRRLANALGGLGLGCHTERSELEGHQSGQDHLALYLHNGNEYLEGMLGAYKARLAPFNVNYRYVADELSYLLADAGATAVLYHAAFAPTLAEVLPSLPAVRVLIQVADESGNELLPGALDYEELLAGASPEPPAVTPSPDDLYILYTGGTTGMPKGVLWRQADIFVAALNGTDAGTGAEWTSYEALADGATGGMVYLPAAPFMHGAGHWVAFQGWDRGNPVVIQSVVERLDPADVWRTIEREGVTFLQIVGDAFARPLLKDLEEHEYDLSKLAVILSGGAALSVSAKEQLLERLPHVMVVDGVGSSEAGGQMSHVSTKDTGASTGDFAPIAGSLVLDEDLTAVLPPGHEGIGWLAKTGRIPLGYLGDPEKTARTFPTIGGERFSVPGDRARLRADGVIELHGRDSVTINSGGEKIFAEEVEAAIMRHPGVFDVVVCGRPSEQWGSEVVAIVQLREGAEVDAEGIRTEAAKHLARYKLPKAVVFLPEVVRSPSGKADYRWAKQTAVEHAG